MTPAADISPVTPHRFYPASPYPSDLPSVLPPPYPVHNVASDRDDEQAGAKPAAATPSAHPKLVEVHDLSSASFAVPHPFEKDIPFAPGQPSNLFIQARLAFTTKIPETVKALQGAHIPINRLFARDENLCLLDGQPKHVSFFDFFISGLPCKKEEVLASHDVIARNVQEYIFSQQDHWLPNAYQEPFSVKESTDETYNVMIGIWNYPVGIVDDDSSSVTFWRYVHIRYNIPLVQDGDSHDVRKLEHDYYILLPHPQLKKIDL